MAYNENPSYLASGSETITQYDVLVGGTSGTIGSVGPGTSGQLLQSAGNAANPAYTTSTYPATNAANTLLYASSANVMAALSTGNSLLAATNASGTLAMRALSINIQVFTSTGTYTPTTGMLYCIIECIGGGGGSGGCASASSAYQVCSGGGGGGGYAIIYESAATIGASQAVTVGAAGLAGVAGNNAGGNGGDSSVGTLCIGKGGTGGGGSASGTPGTGGAGGVAGTGSFTCQGGAGSDGVYLGGTYGSMYSSYGGNSLYGAGGQAKNTNTSNITGYSGQLYGGGGGGSGSYNAGGTQIGAVGAKGVVIITEFIIN